MQNVTEELYTEPPENDKELIVPLEGVSDNHAVYKIIHEHEFTIPVEWVNYTTTGGAPYGTSVVKVLRCKCGKETVR